MPEQGFEVGDIVVPVEFGDTVQERVYANEKGTVGMVPHTLKRTDSTEVFDPTYAVVFHDGNTLHFYENQLKKA